MRGRGPASVKGPQPFRRPAVSGLSHHDTTENTMSTTPRPTVLDDLPGSVLSHYRQARRIGYGSAEALSGARVLDRAEDEEEAGRVRLRFEPDEDGDLSFLDGWEEEGTRQARAAVASVRETAHRDGVWCAISEVRVPGCDRCGAPARWEVVDTLGGLIGDPETENGLPFAYRVDILSAALSALDEAEEARAE